MGDLVPEEILDLSLRALVTANGKCKRAAALIKAECGRSIPAAVLYTWKTETHKARYEQVREQLAPEVERQLTSNLRDASVLASEAMNEAIEKAMKRIEAGDDPDPAKTAANLATVADKSARNMFMLQGRPQVVKENRDAMETLRGLVARYGDIFQLTEVEEPEQIPEATEATEAA